MVLGFELEEKGICRVYDAEHPKKSTGGVAHFQFKPNDKIGELLNSYDKGEANVTLDQYLDLNKSKAKGCDLAFLEELEPLLRSAIIVWMRQAIDSYHNIVWFLQHDATELVVTGGDIAHDDEGNVIHGAKENFTVKVIKKQKIK